MKFSLLYLPAYEAGARGGEAAIYDQMFAEVDHAERHGYHRVWVAEHHGGGYGGQLPCVPIMLAALAQRTRRIGLASGAVCIPLHRPMELAEQLAMVDVLSGGRLHVGCATAFLPHEFAAYELDMDEARERFREGIEVIRGLWTQERFAFDGQFSRFPATELTPKPVQKPHPRMSIATVMTRESFEYAGHNGFDLMVVPYINSLEDVAERIGWYHAALREAGHDPAEFNVMAAFHAYCHEDDAVAYERMKKPMHDYLACVRDSAHGHFGKGYAGYARLAEGVQALMDSYDLMYRERTLLGTPDKLVLRVRDCAAAGITELSFITLLPALSAAHAMASLELITAQVIPACSGVADGAARAAAGA
ncbi:MAG: LLM class flavin-dependent oxidoreductase [Gammaproteobacteria bacterium]